MQPGRITPSHYWDVPPTENLWQQPKCVTASYHNPGRSLNLNLYLNLYVLKPTSKNDPIFSLCCTDFPCVGLKFPVFSLSGKTDDQIPCFPCAVATLLLVVLHRVCHLLRKLTEIMNLAKTFTCTVLLKKCLLKG